MEKLKNDDKWRNHIEDNDDNSWPHLNIITRLKYSWFGLKKSEWKCEYL